MKLIFLIVDVAFLVSVHLHVLNRSVTLSIANAIVFVIVLQAVEKRFPLRVFVVDGIALGVLGFLGELEQTLKCLNSRFKQQRDTKA